MVDQCWLLRVMVQARRSESPATTTIAPEPLRAGGVPTEVIVVSPMTALSKVTVPETPDCTTRQLMTLGFAVSPAAPVSCTE